GSLGRATNAVIADIVRLVDGRRPVSAALGELVELNEPDLVPGLAFVKCGLSRLRSRSRWIRQLERFRKQVGQCPQPPTVVTVAYVDGLVAAAPAWREVADFALAEP